MFAYGNNNSITRKDDSGEIWNTDIGAVSGAIVEGALSFGLTDVVAEIVLSLGKISEDLIMSTTIGFGTSIMSMAYNNVYNPKSKTNKKIANSNNTAKRVNANTKTAKSNANSNKSFNPFQFTHPAKPPTWRDNLFDIKNFIGGC